MSNVRVAWTLPTTRESGKPLDVSAIEGVRIEISADGVAFGEFGFYPPGVLETVVSDLEAGEWTFRGTVVDKAARESAPVQSSIVLEDVSAPGALVSLDLSVVA